MNKVIALYARQSILKEDSISVDSQVEYCKYEARGEAYREYIDRGYSGKNTNRPAFEEMLQDIERGGISKVVVYKLDRISRSILDFSNMMEKFQEHQVEFISTTEKFDTSTPIGRAMLNICIVFAQLERETIQKRVADAYYARSKKGFYMGGRIPYGFITKKTVIDGVNTSCYIEVPEEADQIRLLYHLYADTNNSLGEIVRYLKEHNIKKLRGSTWSTARISELLRNPVYVQADAYIYEFFQKQGANIINPVEDFIGINACYLYQGSVSNTRKQKDLTDKDIVLAPHKGLVSSKVWLKCRIRCLNNRQSAKGGKAKNSWLVGKVKCGKCGYALTVAKANTKMGRYFVCSNRLTKKICEGVGRTIYAERLEAYIESLIEKKLLEFHKLTMQDRDENPKVNDYKIRLTQIEGEIEKLLEKISSANEVLMDYMNKRIKKLDIERCTILKDMDRFFRFTGEKEGKVIKNPVEMWDKLSFSHKQAVTDTLINMIYIKDNAIEIIWKL